MGARVHKLSDKDFVARTAVCEKCGPVELKIIGNAWQCINGYRESRSRMRRTRTDIGMPEKSDTCSRCGFVCEDPCQMDRDHRGGDRTNNADVQTLCANCHRLKSFRPDLFPVPV